MSGQTTHTQGFDVKSACPRAWAVEACMLHATLGWSGGICTPLPKKILRIQCPDLASEVILTSGECLSHQAWLYEVFVLRGSSLSWETMYKAGAAVQAA